MSAVVGTGLTRTRSGSSKKASAGIYGVNIALEDTTFTERVDNTPAVPPDFDSCRGFFGVLD